MDADLRSRGWTRLELAAEAEVSITTVSNVLNGISHSTKAVKRMAIALGHPIGRYVIQPRVPQEAA